VGADAAGVVATGAGAAGVVAAGVVAAGVVAAGVVEVGADVAEAGTAGASEPAAAGVVAEAGVVTKAAGVADVAGPADVGDSAAVVGPADVVGATAGVDAVPASPADAPEPEAPPGETAGVGVAPLGAEDGWSRPRTVRAATATPSAARALMNQPIPTEFTGSAAAPTTIATANATTTRTTGPSCHVPVPWGPYQLGPDLNRPRAVGTQAAHRQGSGSARAPPPVG
jgi:hypothetical protein